MLLLAVVAVSAIALARRTVAFPAWTAYPSSVLAAALTGPGFGYLLLSPALARTAYVSQPVPLIRMAGAGAMLARAEPVGAENGVIAADLLCERHEVRYSAARARLPRGLSVPVSLRFGSLAVLRVFGWLALLARTNGSTRRSGPR